MTNKNKSKKIEPSDLEVDRTQFFRRTKEEKLRNKRRERHIDHAIRTLDIDELIEWEENSE